MRVVYDIFQHDCNKRCIGDEFFKDFPSQQVVLMFDKVIVGLVKGSVNMVDEVDYSK